MATESAAVSGHPIVVGGAKVGEKGLKKDAIGYLSNVVIGVASTAPAYSLAVTLGFIAADEGIGTHAPGVLIASFVPMLLVALGYRYLNRADPDAGTTFAWTTRAFGPGTGWLNGWAIVLADVLVMAVPSRFACAAIVPIAQAITSNAMIVSVTKGLEPDTLLTMSAMLGKVAAQ